MINNQTRTMSFDFNDRMASVTKGATTTNDYLSTTTVNTFQYDIIGNITNKSDVGNYLYQNSNPYQTNSVNGRTYTYDANGNLTNDTQRTITYNWFDLPSAITKSSVTTNYYYDHAKSRVAKYYPATHDIKYYPNQYYEQVRGGASQKNIFLGNQMIGTVDSNGMSLIFTDHLNSSSVVTNTNGNILNLIDYYPFGSERITIKNGSYDPNYRFTGQEYDSEAGQYNFDARYYQQGIGRFNSQDPVFLALSSKRELKQLINKEQQELLINPQTLNTYSYTLNNPLIYIDPLGLAEIYIREAGPKNANTYEPKNWEQMFGHVMVEIDGTYYGFAPTNDQKSDVQVFSEEQFQKEYNDQTWVVVDIGDKYDEKIKSEFEKLQSEGQEVEGGEYREFTNNCTQKMDEILEKAGVYNTIGLRPFTPGQLLDKFKRIEFYDSISHFFDSDYEERIKSIWTEEIPNNSSW